MTYEEERRRFFRIDDEVNLYYKPIEEKMVDRTSHISDNVLGNCSLAAALEMISQESRILMHRLERNSPEVADYLKIMESKIDLIAQELMLQGSDFKEKDTLNVNLSASGLAFDCTEELNVDDYLEIKMLLVSCMAVIVTYARVVYCKQKTDADLEFPYVVGVDYINMKDQDRELLIKHIVKRQMQQIRERKEVPKI